MVGVRTCFSSAKASGKFKNHHLIVIIWHLKSSDFFLTLQHYCQKLPAKTMIAFPCYYTLTEK